MAAAAPLAFLNPGLGFKKKRSTGINKIMIRSFSIIIISHTLKKSSVLGKKRETTFKTRCLLSIGTITFLYFLKKVCLLFCNKNYICI